MLPFSYICDVFVSNLVPSHLSVSVSVSVSVSLFLAFPINAVSRLIVFPCHIPGRVQDESGGETGTDQARVQSKEQPQRHRGVESGGRGAHARATGGPRAASGYFRLSREGRLHFLLLRLFKYIAFRA